MNTTKPVRRILITIIALLVCTSSLSAADGPGLPAQVAQQPPKLELPPLPADGAGIYRVTLDQAVLGTPLLVYLDVKGGKVAKAMANPIDKMPLPCRRMPVNWRCKAAPLPARSRWM
jgi:hypothetical protein